MSARTKLKSLALMPPKSVASATMALGAAEIIFFGALHVFGKAATDGHSDSFFVWIVLGVLTFLAGLFGYLARPRIINPFENAPTDFNALLRGMVGAAEYSGTFPAQKVDLIRSILQQVYRKEFDRTAVENACQALMGEEEDLRMHLFDWHAQLSEDFRRLIVQAGALVISSDAPINKDSEEFLLQMSRALLLPDDELASIIARRHELLEAA